MIALADDLTGAAELGGIAWRYGLPAAIAIGTVPVVRSGLLVVDTESRGMGASGAAGFLKEVARRCGPPLLFKKIDSALRGPVMAEAEAVLQALKLPRALLVPANPSLGRTIQGGIYRIDGVPIAETEFRNDPDHPARSSRVTELVPGLRLLPAGAPLPPSGVFLGQTVNDTEVRHWARQVDAHTLAVGAADLFRALLEEGGYRNQRRKPEGIGDGSRLFVSGTASERSRQWFELQAAKGQTVAKLPQRVIEGGEDEPSFVRWTNRVAAALESTGLASMIIGRPALAGGKRPHYADLLVRGAAEVIALSPPAVVCVEGGATASALARQMGWTTFEVCEELDAGVVVLEPSQPPVVRLVLKPGSYPWTHPEEES